MVTCGKMESTLNDIVKHLEEVAETNKTTNKALGELVSKMEGTGKAAASRIRSLEAQMGKSIRGASVLESTAGEHVRHDHDYTDGDSIEEEVVFNNKHENDSQEGLIPSVASQGSGLATIQTDDLQAEFKSIQDRYARIPVSSDLRFNASKSGIKQASREASNVMVNSAKYMEAGLKILTFVQKKTGEDPGFLVNRQLQELFVVLYTGLCYLQEDHMALRIGSQYGPRTQMIYRDLSKNTSSYPVGALERLEHAVRFAALPTEFNPVQRRGAFSGWSGGPRGGFRGGFRAEAIVVRGPEVLDSMWMDSQVHLFQGRYHLIVNRTSQSN